jgi:predicted DNA binding CopG/RHH family protein
MPFDPTAYKTEYNRQAYDQITLRVPKGERERIAQTAAERGLSVNEYIRSLIEEDKEKSK